MNTLEVFSVDFLSQQLFEGVHSTSAANSGAETESKTKPKDTSSNKCCRLVLKALNEFKSRAFQQTIRNCLKKHIEELCCIQDLHQLKQRIADLAKAKLKKKAPNTVSKEEWVRFMSALAEEKLLKQQLAQFVGRTTFKITSNNNNNNIHVQTTSPSPSSSAPSSPNRKPEDGLERMKLLTERLIRQLEVQQKQIDFLNNTISHQYLQDFHLTQL